MTDGANFGAAHLEARRSPPGPFAHNRRSVRCLPPRLSPQTAQKTAASGCSLVAHPHARSRSPRVFAMCIISILS